MLLRLVFLLAWKHDTDLCCSCLYIVQSFGSVSLPNRNLNSPSVRGRSHEARVGGAKEYKGGYIRPKAVGTLPKNIANRNLYKTSMSRSMTVFVVTATHRKTLFLRTHNSPRSLNPGEAFMNRSQVSSDSPLASIIVSNPLS